MDEEVLAGGVANPGLVVRVADTVRRPVTSHTATVHRLLRYLVDRGLEGRVPTPLGIDDRGREILSFLPGSVANPPYPDWIADDDLLSRVAELQRSLHVAAVGFEPRDDDSWDTSGYFPTEAAGPLVCHNDLCVENIVIGDGGSVAAIDWDYARPVDRLFDIAVAARHWIPMRAPEDIDDARRDADHIGRFAVFCEAHGLDRRARAAVVTMTIRFLDAAYVNVQRLAAGGHAGFAEMVAKGYPLHNRRSVDWLSANDDRLVGPTP
jgi:hypothetical protein